MGNSDQLDPDDAFDIVNEIEVDLVSDLGATMTAVENERFEEANSCINGMEGGADRIIEVGQESGEEHYVEFGKFVLDSCQELREAIQNEDFEEMNRILNALDQTGSQSFFILGEND